MPRASSMPLPPPAPPHLRFLAFGRLAATIRAGASVVPPAGPPDECPGPTTPPVGLPVGPPVGPPARPPAGALTSPFSQADGSDLVPWSRTTVSGGIALLS